MRLSKSTEDWEIEKQFAPFWKELADQIKVLFPDGDDKGAFIIPALDARSHVLSINDRRNGCGKPVFKLASLGSGQLFSLFSLHLSVLGVFFAVWRVEASFSAASFPFQLVLHVVPSLTLKRA